MSQTAIALCAVIWMHAGAKEPIQKNRMKACVKVATEARTAGVPPALMVAIAWVESRYNPTVVSSAGAVGILQVIPRYHCPKKTAKGCNTIKRGVLLMRRLIKRYGVLKALASYNAGPRRWKLGVGYARLVMRLQRKVERAPRQDYAHAMRCFYSCPKCCKAR